MLTGAGAQVAGEHLHGGRLARTIGAEEAHHFAAVDLEIDVAHDDAAGETARQRTRVEGGEEAGSDIGELAA